MAILLAYATSPATVGIYTWLTLGITLFLSVADGAVRQVAVLAWRSRDGLRLIGAYVRVAGPAGVLAVTVIASIVAVVSGQWGVVLSAAPLLLVPLVNVQSVRATAFMQIRGKWRSLAAIQTSSAALSLLASVPLLLAFESLLGPALQLLLTELLYTVMVRRRASKEGMQMAAAQLADGARVGRAFGHLSAQAALGWVQGQADRILLGAFAGTAALGSYSLALALGRNPGDAISMATANVGRATVASHSDAVESRLALDRLLIRALPASGLFVFAIAVGVQAVLPQFLDSASWGDAIRASGPILLSTVATVYAWSLSPVLIQFGAGRVLTWVKLLGLVFAPLVAIAATSSLQLAAWLVLAREVVMMLGATAIRWRLAPRRAFMIALAIIVAGSAALELFTVMFAA